MWHFLIGVIATLVVVWVVSFLWLFKRWAKHDDAPIIEGNAND